MGDIGVGGNMTVSFGCVVCWGAWGSLWFVFCVYDCELYIFSCLVISMVRLGVLESRELRGLVSTPRYYTNTYQYLRRGAFYSHYEPDTSFGI